MIKLTQADILGIHQPNMVEPRKLSAFEFHDMSVQELFLAVQDSSIGDLVTHSLSQSDF